MLAYVYHAPKNKNNKNNDRRVISIAQLCLSAVLKIKLVFVILLCNLLAAVQESTSVPLYLLLIVEYLSIELYGHHKIIPTPFFFNFPTFTSCKTLFSFLAIRS